MDGAHVVAQLGPLLSEAVIATDFDGTLAPLVSDPQQSRPVDGAIDALTTLAERGAHVAVVTGRDAETVVRLGGLHAVPGLSVQGLYGLETWSDGALDSPDTPAALDALHDALPGVVAEASSDPDVWIEDKRLSLVVHTRRAADPARELAALQEPVRALADRLELEIHPGSNVLEVRLPGYDKAGALSRLVDEHRPRAVLYLGDDVGDLPAFERVRELRHDGMTGYGVGVLSSGVAEVAAAADVTVADPAAATELLRALAAT
jgi:trehalose 6-phosphate phosphatase